MMFDFVQATQKVFEIDENFFHFDGMEEMEEEENGGFTGVIKGGHKFMHSSFLIDLSLRTIDFNLYQSFFSFFLNVLCLQTLGNRIYDIRTCPHISTLYAPSWKKSGFGTISGTRVL